MSDPAHERRKLSFHRLLLIWQIDDATRATLRRVRPIVEAALEGHEAEFAEAFLADPQVARLMQDEAVRRREIDTLHRYWRSVFGGELGETTVQHAASIGRQHVEFGLGGRYLMAACQRLLKRAVEALIAANPPHHEQAIDAVTRVVLLTADVALSAYYDSVTSMVSQMEVHRETEQLHEQLKALEELARVDPLTRLFNRRHFDEMIEVEISRAERQKHPLTLIMADIDLFKAVNDTYGHAAGDLVLRSVAGALQTAGRRSDVVARYGGEEFAILLPHTPADRAVHVAGRLRTLIAGTAVEIGDDRTVSVTVSFGIAGLREKQSAAELTAAADAALYRAKANGRDRVEA